MFWIEIRPSGKRKTKLLNTLSADPELSLKVLSREKIGTKASRALPMKLIDLHIDGGKCLWVHEEIILWYSVL